MPYWRAIRLILRRQGPAGKERPPHPAAVKVVYIQERFDKIGSKNRIETWMFT